MRCTWEVPAVSSLKGAGLFALGVGWAQPTSLDGPPGPGRRRRARRCSWKVFLRGGADGLNLCAPHGDSDYYALRGDIALPRPGAAGGLINLDGFFGLHPVLRLPQASLRRPPAGLVHAVGSYVAGSLALPGPGFHGERHARSDLDADGVAGPDHRPHPGRRT